MQDKRSDFAEYVAARRPELRRMAYGMCGDWHAADDVVQIAVSKLYRAWPRVHRAGAEDAYVRRTIARTVIDESRRPWRRERPVEVSPDRDVKAVDSATHLDIFTALATLPPQQHRVVVLRHWWGLSVIETAETLGISEGTVKSQSSKGLEKLRPLLDNIDTDLKGTTR